MENKENNNEKIIIKVELDLEDATKLGAYLLDKTNKIAVDIGNAKSTDEFAELSGVALSILNFLDALSTGIEKANKELELKSKEAEA